MTANERMRAMMRQALLANAKDWSAQLHAKAWSAQPSKIWAARAVLAL